MDQTEHIDPIDTLAELLGVMPHPDTVQAMEHALLAQPQIDMQTTTVVHGGLCTRTVFIPAGTLLTGALTNLDNIGILSGDIVVTTDTGTQRLTGYHVLAAAKGFKRAGLAIAGTYWSTTWRTDLTDAQAIEDEFTDESHMLQNRHMPFLAQQDYRRWVVESGFSEQFIAGALAYTDDLIETPDCLLNLRKGTSTIEGTGIFATRALSPGEAIAPGRRAGMRCVAGRYTNHSPHPNAQFVAAGEDLNLVALHEIADGDEVTVDYRQAVAANTALQGVRP